MYFLWVAERQRFEPCDLVIPDDWSLAQIRAFMNWVLAHPDALRQYTRMAGIPAEFAEMVRWVPEEDERMQRMRRW